TTSRGIAHLGAAAIIGDEVSVYPQQYKPGNDIFYDGLIFHDGNYQYEE
ncbi:phage tail protein I, partial [Klebsiella pneumoniae]|nr:phage tail protein I [Klebsiella pneumoniae]